MAYYSQQDIYNKLVAGGIDAHNAQILAATAHGESGLNTEAIGDNGNSFGLFQIYIPAHYDKLERMTGSSDRGYWEEWLKDPLNNINAAIAVYQSQGLGAWTIYNIGAYKQYLNEIDPAAASSSPSASILDQDAHLSTWTPTLWEKIKGQAKDTWYYISGTNSTAAIYPSAAEQLKAREQFNAKYGLNLPTESLQAEVNYQNSVKLSNKLFTAGTLLIIFLIVVIIGGFSFFKAFNIEPPALPIKA